MDADDLPELDARISALEAEWQRLKTQRLAHLGRQSRPLDGLRVFDLSRLIFGPFCIKMLPIWEPMSLKSNAGRQLLPEAGAEIG